MTSPFSDAPPASAPPPGPPLPPVRHQRWPVVVAVAIAVVGLVVIVGSVIRLPYVIYSPGDATPVDDIIEITGARTYRHKGEVFFLTVSVSRDDPNIWRFLAAKTDDDVRIVGKDQYLQGSTRKQVQRENVVAMDDSQLAAKKVALEELGYEVTATGAGAIVGQVVPDTPADGHLRAGDVITAIDGEPVRLADQVGEIVRGSPAGTTFTFTVTRDGRTRAEEITSEEAPSGDLQGKPFIGIGLAGTKDLKLDFPVDVTIDPGSVTGPSAGLAFTLTIIDQLSPGNLTGGKDIAVTGTMGFEGDVGEVGGVPQKTASAIDAGADLFLVPAAEVKQARARAGDALQVVGVRTIDDALRALRENGGDPVEPIAPPAAA
jgi:PDZ domain-containing protein